MKIFIDPGHGGNDPGAVGNGMREADIALEVSRELEGILRRHGIETRLSRDASAGATINQRWQAANAWAADYLVSIHVNAGGGTGAETFVSATKPNNRTFALAVNDHYADAMGLRNRGVKADTQTFVGSLGVLRHSHMPAILIELAFIDSPPQNPDTEALRNRRQDMAEALSESILNFLGIKPESEIKIEGVEEMRYNTIAEMPEWARPTIKKLIERGMLRGDGQGLSLSEDMIRVFVIHDRAGLYELVKTS